MRAGAGAAFSAGCLADYGEPGLSAAADLRPVHSPGSGPGVAVRSAAPLPAAASPAHRPAGHGLLSDGRRGRLLLSHGAGRRRTAGLHGVGRRGRSGAVLLRLLPMAAPHLGFLGGHPGVLGIFVVFSRSLDQKFLRKNGPPRKKSLLFFREMLYNNKKWTQSIS